MRRKFLLSWFLVLLLITGNSSILNAEGNVAKVGNTEYATIDEAIAAWTNNTTLTLLDNVTLSDVVTIKSTEHHILNLGTYTMTAASGKNAFVIQACGTGSAERSAITINADATNPGGINAGSKCVIYYKYADGGISAEDRPIIKINGGVFTGSTSSWGTAGIYTIGTAARKCATVNVAGGTFNCSIVGSGKSKLIVSGGLFNYTVSSQGDSTCSRLISGGTFKTLGFMTADDNNTKFWIGTSMGNSNVGVHVDDNGYIVVGGPVVTEAGESFEASSANYSGASSYLQYSSAKDNGLYYTSVEEAFADNNKASGSVTVYVDELDMTDISYKGTIVVPEGEKITIVTAAGVTPTWTVSANNDAVTYTDAEGNELVKDENGSFVVPPVAKIGETSYETLQAAVDAVQNGQTITLLADAAEDVTIPAGVTFNGNGKAVGNITAAGTITFNGHTKATSFNVENTNTTINIVEGACLDITGSGRMVIGHGCTFNITGTIADAKTANVADVTPSLVMPGASFTGAGVTFNVTNAYLSAPSSYCSSSSSASGTLDFNITNSIWESAGKLAFEAQSTAATVNFELKDSKLTTGSHLVFGVSRGEVVIDNSNVNVGSSRQIENQSTMTIKNGAVVNGAVATSSNAKNPGTIIVENATYAVTGEFSGSDLGTGTLIVKKGATVSAGSITKANIQIDATGMTTGDEINLTANLANLAGTLEVINNDNLDAEIIDGKIVLVKKTVAMIGDVKYSSLQEAFTAATSGCTIEILSNVTIDEAWDNRYTGAKFTVPVTINGNDNKLTFNGAVSDGGNYHSVFRFQADATVKNLTIDLTNATNNNDRVRAISSSANLVVEECNFIGSNNVNNARAIIFGEGAGANVGNLVISITNSKFINWNRGITDNENGQDVKTVTITGNTLTSSAVYVSAKETVTFTGNTVSGAYVNIRSYSDENNLSVTATGNTLEGNTENNYNYIYAKNIEAQEEFVTKNPPLKVSTKAELNAAINAAKDGDVIEMTADIDYGTDQLAIAKAITLDLGGKTLTTRNGWGGMSIKNNPTIKNGNIVHASNTAAIKVWNATAFEDLVIDVQGKGDANKTIGGIVLQSGSTTRVGSIKNVTIEGDALTNGIETYNCGDAEGDVIGSMENVNIDAVGTAMLISAPCGTATNCTFDGGVNGIEIWIKGNYSASLGLVDCDVVGGVFAHDEFSSNPEIVNNGTLNLTADEATTGAGVDDVTLTLARVEAENVEGVLEVVMEQAEAKVNNTYYQTLAEAVAAAQDGEEIDLLKDVALTSTLLLTKNNILDGNGFKLTPAEGGFTPDGNNAVIVLAANMSGYEANRTYTVKNLTIEGFSTPSRIVRANFCDATIQNCIFDNNTSASIITSAYAVLNVAGNTFKNNTATGYAVIDVGSDVNDGTNLKAEIKGNKFYNNEAATAGIYLASSADVTGNHFKDNTHTGDNANAAAILAGPYTGNRAYTVNINSNAFENAMSKDVTALPSVFAEDWSSLGSTTSFDLSLNYWDGNEPVAGTAYKTSGDNPQVTVKSYYKTYTDGTLGGLVEYPQGNDFTGYTSADAIWGEVWGNAQESFVVKVLDANGNVMGTTSLNNIGGIIDGDVNVTWNIKLDAASNTDEYWTMAWTTVPTINNMPAKVELWVDGVKVSGGPVVLNAPDNLSMIYAAVTDNTGKILAYHTNVQEAIKAAAAVTGGARTTTAGTVEFLADVTVDKWIMFSETLSIGNGQIITIEKIEGLTIDGNDHTLTINSIESAGNGNRLFYDATNLNIKDLIINYKEGVVGGIGLKSGTISNVNFNGGVSAIYPGAGEVIITDCTFKTSGHCIYFEEERDNLVVTNNTFELPADANVILLRGDVTFTGNNVKSGRTVNVVSGSPVVTGNNFNDVRFKVYNAASATISENTINNLVFNETDVPTESTFTNNTLSPEAQAAIDALPAIAGEGTEANPYLINDVDDLVWLQEKVDELAEDGSTQFAGKYFKLTNDIDLSGINWDPIGTMNGDHSSFKGVFDGGDHTISNLHVEQAGNGIGLFARTTGNAVIKNLKLNNVTVESTDNSNYVGGLVGNAFASTKIENVHVSGNVYISGRGYIGGIAGHGYVVMDNVSVVATGDGKGNNKGLITSTFWCAGGVLGYAGEGATNIMNAHVENVVVTSAAGGLGAIVGMAEDNNGTQPISGSNLSAKNVEIKTYTGAYGDSYANYALGYLYGGNPTSILTGELSVDNVIITTSNGVAPEVTDAVAQIGNSIYFNLQDVLNAGGNVTVLRDIALAEGLTVAADKTVVLDLNGKTITGTPAEAKAFAVITNKGDLTITDGTETEGKIVCDHKLVGSTSYAVNTITNSGTLKIAAGTIQNTSTASNQIGYAIDNNSTTGNTILVIEGGEVTASGSGYYDGIRQFCNSETNENSVTIIDGEVSSLWLQNPNDGIGTQNTKDVKGSFAINGGTLNNLYLEPSTQFAGAIIGGHVGNISRFQTAEGRDLEGFISGGTFSSDVSEFCAKGFVCNDNGDGTYGVVEKSAVAKIDDVEYKYIQDAIDAANATDVINVVSSTTENITIAENDNITLTFSEGVTLNGYFAPFRGNLTINGGTINNANSGASAIEINAGVLNLNNVNIASARHAVRIDGAVTATINGGEYTLTATSGTRHAVNVSGGAEVTIKAGTFVGPKGTTMDSGSAVCVQASSKVTIEGGDFSGGKNHTLSADGNLIVTGGTFDQDPSAYLAQGYITKYNETTSRYEVFKGVAKIENEYFASIQDAIDAAQNNDVIVVLENIDLSTNQFVTLDNSFNTYFKVEGKAVTIDLNGKTISGEYAIASPWLVGVFSTENNGHLTLEDNVGTAKVDITGVNGEVYALIANYESDCSITINGGTYILDDVYYGSAPGALVWSSPSANDGEGIRVNGGNFHLGNVATGSNASPWIFNVNGNNSGHIKVFGGTYNYNVFNQYWVFEVQTTKEYAIKYDGDEAGTWTVVPAVAWVNNQKQSGGNWYTYELGYATLVEAFAAAEDCNKPDFAETVTLLQDITLENTILENTITVNAGKDVILDLNGKNITQTQEFTGSYSMIDNKGKLTIGGNGTIKLEDLSQGGGATWGTYIVNNNGELIVNDATLEHLGTAGDNFSTCIPIQNYQGKVTVNEGAYISSPEFRSLRDFTAGGEIIINGGEFNGQIWMQGLGDGSSSLTIKGGEFGPTANDGSSVFITNGTNVVNVSIEGGLFNTKIGATDPTKEGVAGCITGGVFTTAAKENTNENLLNENFAFAENADGTWTVKPAQEQSLVAGWNWYSTYLDIDLSDLTTALGDNGVQIKNQIAKYKQYDDNHGTWFGTLSVIDLRDMYMVNVKADQTLKVAAPLAVTEEYTITINPGWNWIGYPSNVNVDINTVLKELTPEKNDLIKTQHKGYAQFNYNKWRGALKTMLPGEGYMYYSNATESKTFVYTVEATKGTVEANVTAENNYWTPDATKYPFNMTMTAVVDGLTDANYEVAAFVNGEVRGSARPIYIEEIDAYVLFLTIHGEDVEEMSFRLYDIDNDTEYDLSDRINYSNDAHLGSVNEPYVFSRGTTGIGEASMSNINIYPNPTTTGTEINLQATCDTVEVFNALGVKVAEYQNVDTIDALETAGIYVIRITNNGNVQNCRLVVK